MNKKNFKLFSDAVMNIWYNGGCVESINKLVKEGKILSVEDAMSAGMDFDEAFDIFWDDVEGELNKWLDMAVGGDWHKVGLYAGYTELELERIYTDEYQAKTDPFVDYYELL